MHPRCHLFSSEKKNAPTDYRRKSHGASLCGRDPIEPVVIPFLDEHPEMNMGEQTVRCAGIMYSKCRRVFLVRCSNIFMQIFHTGWQLSYYPMHASIISSSWVKILVIRNECLFAVPLRVHRYWILFKGPAGHSLPPLISEHSILHAFELKRLRVHEGDVI